MDDEFESVLFIARECFVYRIPPRAASAGYRAAEWGDLEVRSLLVSNPQLEYSRLRANEAAGA